MNLKSEPPAKINVKKSKTMIFGTVYNINKSIKFTFLTVILILTFPILASSSIPGTIQAEDFDKGGEGIAYHDMDSVNQGDKYRPTEGVDIESTTNTGTGYNLGWIRSGEWLKYTTTVSTKGTYTIKTHVASKGSGGTFHIEFNGVDKTGPMTIPNTGGWQNWQILSRTVTLNSGQQVMKIVMDSDGASGYVGNINYIRITSPTSTPIPTPIVTPNLAPIPPINICNTKDCTLKYKELELLNNMWGSSNDGPTTTQSQFYSDSGIIGWAWSRLNPVECYPGVICPNYPEVRYTLPNNIAFGDIDTWTSDIEWKYTTVPSGYYDLAFDLWASNNQRTQTEIMINLEGGLAGETFQGTVTDGINQYNYNYFYAGEKGGQTDWNYVVFTLANQNPVQANVKYSKSVNIKALISQIPQSYLDPSWVLPDIHFGNEVWNDAGRIEISKYSINLNGNII